MSSSTHRLNTLIKKRDKQSQHAELWSNHQHYYSNWSTKNTKFNEWTSPRYHAQQHERIQKFKTDRERTENLEKRRQLLCQLLHEDEKNEKYELMLRKNKSKTCYKKREGVVVPTDVLKELNLGLKLEEEDRRRYKAEMGLYHQWRNTNPVLKHYERMYKGREMKLSWLDQQIEARMRKEQQEEESRRMLNEYKKRQIEEAERERLEKEEIEAKNKALRSDLEKQIAELQKKTAESEELKKQEEKEMIRLNEIEKLEKERVEEERQRREKEIVLFNIKQCRMKLRKKLEFVKKELDEQSEYIEKLKTSELCERVENEKKREELKRSLDEFLRLVRGQKELEKVRERHFEFLFDSEAREQFERQSKQWAGEERLRRELVESVVGEVKEQIKENVRRVREEAKRVVKEREEMLKRIEECDEEMRVLKVEERERKKKMGVELKREIEKKKEEEMERESESEVKRIDFELEEVRKEEERIKREILEMQRRQGPIRPKPSRIFF